MGMVYKAIHVAALAKIRPGVAAAVAFTETLNSTNISTSTQNGFTIKVEDSEDHLVSTKL